MELIEDEIRNKISENSREGIVYIHPIVTNEKIAQFISGFSNTQGGIVVFGIKDNGVSLAVKNFPFQIDIEAIKEKLVGRVEITSGEYFESGSKFYFISVSKSPELVSVNDVAYCYTENNLLERYEMKKVFVSYAHKDSDLVDILEQSLSLRKDIILSRDINDAHYRDSLDDFMNTIRSNDIIISLVSSEYLKSINCMYEITQLMKDNNYHDRLYFIIVSDNDLQYYSKEKIYDSPNAHIYDIKKKILYAEYWNKFQNDFELLIKQANIRTSMLETAVRDMKKVEAILPTVGDYINLISDRVGKDFDEMYKMKFENIFR